MSWAVPVISLSGRRENKGFTPLNDTAKGFLLDDVVVCHAPIGAVEAVVQK